MKSALRKRLRTAFSELQNQYEMNVASILKCILIFSVAQSCAAQKSPDITGTLQGVTGVFQGNCMPSPGQSPCQPSPISTTIYVTEQSEKFSIELLQDSVVSAENGKYKISLPAGSYSLFMRDGNEIVCRSIQCSGPCLCMPFTVAADSVTILDPNLDRASW